MATQSQVVNGQQYALYSPEWYAAQQNDVINRSGIAGTAAGTSEANYLSKVGPSLAGLYSASGLTGRSGSGSFAPSAVSYPGAPSSPSSSSVGTVNYQAPSDSAATPPPSTIAPLNFDNMNTAAFATAKDQAAQTAGASMRGLEGALAGRGMGGAGYEAGQIGNTVAGAANQIGAASRAEATKESELRARAAEANLSAEVAQRGQTIGANESAANRASQQASTAFEGGIAQRGQTIGADTAAANRDAAAREAAYSGGIAQRAQDIGAAETSAELAQRQAELKSNQTLAILRSVMGGGAPSPNNPYVY